MDIKKVGKTTLTVGVAGGIGAGSAWLMSQDITTINKQIEEQEARSAAQQLMIMETQGEIIKANEKIEKNKDTSNNNKILIQKAEERVDEMEIRLGQETNRIYTMADKNEKNIKTNEKEIEKIWNYLTDLNNRYLTDLSTNVGNLRDYVEQLEGEMNEKLKQPKEVLILVEFKDEGTKKLFLEQQREWAEKIQKEINTSAEDIKNWTIREIDSKISSIVYKK